MRDRFPVFLAALMLALAASPAPAQTCVNCACGQQCNTSLCGEICLDNALCSNGTHVACRDNSPYCPMSPIIIDTKDQGFHLTSMMDGVKFTFGADRLQTSWTNPDYFNAWLALDRNGNGVVDDASELFGEFTPQPPGPNPNGFKALAVFDDLKNGGNHNGKIDPGDAIWHSLRLWIDRNHNGISEPSELVPLSEAGVFSISLNYSLSEKTDAYGNEFRYVANIQDQYGHQDPVCYDVLLVTAVPGLATTRNTRSESAKDEDAGTAQQ